MASRVSKGLASKDGCSSAVRARLVSLVVWVKTGCNGSEASALAAGHGGADVPFGAGGAWSLSFVALLLLLPEEEGY